MTPNWHDTPVNLFWTERIVYNPLMPGLHKKVIKQACSWKLDVFFKYVTFQWTLGMTVLLMKT